MYLKTYINRWLPSWVNTFPNFDVALRKAVAHSDVSLHRLKNRKVDNGKSFRVLLTELLLVKLNVHGCRLTLHKK